MSRPRLVTPFVSNTIGSNTIGSDTIGSNTIGSNTIGSNTIGSDTIGSDTIGSNTIGSDTIGSDTNNVIINLYIAHLRNDNWKNETLDEKNIQLLQELGYHFSLTIGTRSKNYYEWEWFQEPYLIEKQSNDGYIYYSVNFSIKVSKRCCHEVVNILSNSRVMYCLPETYFWKIGFNSIRPCLDENHLRLRKLIHNRIAFGRLVNQRNYHLEMIHQLNNQLFLIEKQIQYYS